MKESLAQTHKVSLWKDYEQFVLLTLDFETLLLAPRYFASLLLLGGLSSSLSAEILQ